MNEETTSLGLRQATLALTPYDPTWTTVFDKEAALIRTALPDVAFEIDHIGSTAVPGLPAKAILDIAMRANEAVEDHIATVLVGLGYIDRGIRSGRLFIRLRNSDVRTHNLHLYRPEEPDYRDQIAFRDALRADPELRDNYAELKQNLVDQFGDAGRRNYTEGKTDFVRAVVNQAR
ncbi:MAG: GrpB family protein [Roseibium sp.]|uniref:GrpB family protein n=1 Tax=Roseibium sp. TaxID=1936156 RepID=UPI0032974964